MSRLAGGTTGSPGRGPGVRILEALVSSARDSEPPELRGLRLSEPGRQRHRYGADQPGG